MLTSARSEYRTWVLDSRRWDHYQPRPDDIIIATYPKCGTTWMQRIVSLLVFQTAEPKPVMEISAWIDRRFGAPLEAVLAQIEAQQHRRFLKSHLPVDGLPFHDDVKYIHVGRDGRDVCISLHNHLTNFSQQVLDRLDEIGMEDETIARPYPRITADPAAYFHQWVTQDGFPTLSFFHFVRTWWEERKRPNVLLVHYKDLKADIDGEMRRIAEFLKISIAPSVWPDLVAAASFEAMRRDGDALMGRVAATFDGGSERFFFKGANERWQGVFNEADISLYEARVHSLLSADCAGWTAQGRLVFTAGLNG